MYVDVRLSHPNKDYLLTYLAQLSLTNPRDALHDDKRQNFKTVT